MKVTIDYAGASIIGQSHLEAALKNQDAYTILESSFGTVMVVADGVGSKPHSDVGSKAICQSVVQAVKIWHSKENAPIQLLIRLIHTLWELNISPLEKKDCSTTCLFAVYLKTGKLYLGQLGDGIIGFIHEDNFSVLKIKEEEFGNLTQSVDSVTSLTDWTIKEIDLTTSNFSLLLATDGISEDLIEDKRKEFVEYLVQLIKEKPALKLKNRRIKKLIKGWITNYSLDDKTMIIFNREVEK
ncbi:hypothetical protein JCM9140_3675 [Halalkalibacter wakoensis JCM 9140]|uniref:PPM-type phosphatase domain-containing protein n=1 Tax=Halalkalibacter wakoensis JCM 9140 TaxID=1236970 RepID=W4Q765_9BACI|nr:PP2C family serine/threonine-protein phosphatase [Halalkalibacter wakoensis]GAE27523.1 hypothetical protein JCM9140_3675 [Halalkalibacter wakoensis JCM 9140]